MIKIDYKKVQTILDESKIIAIPTETVYGFAINYDDEKAFDNLCSLKKRREDKPIAVMVKKEFDFDKYFFLSEKSKRIIDRFLPGPITLVLKEKGLFPYQCHLGTNKVGIRIPSDELILDLLSKLNKPLQVTSANISSFKPCTSYEEVKKSFNDDNLGMIIKGKCKSKIPSTIIDLSNEEIKILREGEISIKAIMEVLK